MQAMIAEPSGLERVRWKASAFSPLPSMTPRILGAARLGGVVALQHQRAGAFGDDEAVAVLGEGPRRLLRMSLVVDSADSSEKRITASGLTEPSVPTHIAASVSPRRIASTPSWIALAPEAQAVDSEIGEPRVPNLSAMWSATEPNRKRP